MALLKLRVSHFHAARSPVTGQEGFLSTSNAGLQPGVFVERPKKHFNRTLINFAIVFFAAYFILFWGMTLHPGAYDEGIILTGSMQVAAGKIPHRDFYAIYGPAQFYILAGFFKLFGESVLVERLVDLFFRASVVASVYVISSSYFRRSIAVYTSLVTLLWLFSLNDTTAGNATIPVSLMNLVSTALVVAVFTRVVSKRRMAVAGVTAGLALLFRYDTGIALLGVHACIIAIGICLQVKGNKMRAFASTFWPYLVGFLVVTLPPAFYYLSVAPLHPLLYDIFIFPSKYYHRARNLPFPGVSLRSLHNFAIYLPIAAVGVSAYAVLADSLRKRNSETSARKTSNEPRLYGFLIAFGLLTIVMYLKGSVRVSVIQMYLATIPSLLLIAALFQQRFMFRRPLRIFITLMVSLSVLAPAWFSVREMMVLYWSHSSLPERIWSSARGTTPAIRAAWCNTENVATRGLCFLPEDDRIQTIEFIDSHTRPDQTLFLGVPKHDRVFANDMLTYFASQRLPATMWAHFDPDLQSRYDIQVQMVHDLEINRPPYVVLDSEYDLIHEPNDSSKSSGVTVLDEYLHKNYRHTETFGDMAIWQRTPSA
jgi:hypothetical protein